MTISKLDVRILPGEYRPDVGDLPGDIQLVAEAVEQSFQGMGVPVAMVLAKRFGGSPLYIRKLNGTLLKWRNDQIRAMYDLGGITGRQLAWYWQLSQSSIEKILAQPGQVGK
ncbi:MAG: Mor transcription activator family protein [Desulfobulbus sp.]|nr:Mor transcription activator family protein [Desulfobulbus sp.]